MSRTSDTIEIIEDSGSRSVTVKYISREDIEEQALPVPRSGTLVTRESATVQIFPLSTKEGGLMRNEKGEIIARTHKIFFPYTSSIQAGDRVYESGESDYYETKKVDEFEDHKRIYGEKVGSR